MPSTSAKQHRFMEAIAHSPSFAKKVGVKQSVGKDFAAADKGKTFAKGGVTQQKINKQDTRHGMMDMPVANLNRFAGMKKGGIMKKRRFDGEEGSLVDDNKEPVVERRSFAKGVRTNPETEMRQNQETGEMYSTDMKQNEETGEMYRTTAPPAKPAAKAPAAKAPAAKAPATKPVATRNPETESQKARSEGNSSGFKPYQPPADKSSSPAKAPASSTAAKNTEVSKGFGGSYTPEERAANRESVAQGVKKAASSFGNYFKDLVTKTRAERYKEANPDKKLAKGGAVMKEPKDAMMPRRPRGMTPPVAPQSPMGMGMKKGGAVMKESKGMMGKEVAFMKKKGAPASMIKHEKAEMGMKRGGMMKYAKGGGIESRGKTKGTIIRMASGGSVSSASRRADGIAQRGKTRC